MISSALRRQTGPTAEVQRVNHLFGMDFFPDEGLMNHSLHTAIIDRQGKLFTNIEGNQFTAEQLGDLVQTVLSRRPERSLAKTVSLGSGSARP
jgi:hypothetical protein